jgi:hypothetical protein
MKLYLAQIVPMCVPHLTHQVEALQHNAVLQERCAALAVECLCLGESAARHCEEREAEVCAQSSPSPLLDAFARCNIKANYQFMKSFNVGPLFPRGILPG